MKKAINILNILVFAAVTLAIAGFVYEAFVLEWFPAVGVLMLTADCLFILSTVVNLIFCRKNKVTLMFNIISFIMIVTAFIIKFGLNAEFPAIPHVLWFFYIWFYYGISLSKKLWIKQSK